MMPFLRCVSAARLNIASSPIHGRGVFTRVPIAAGAAVMVCSGRIISRMAVREGMHVMQVGPDEYLAGDPSRPSCDDYVNHSCEPNLGFVRGTPTLHALHAIPADAELVFDYSTSMNEPGWMVRCLCCADCCRGYITSYCDLPTVVRRRLAPISLDYLRSLQMA